MNEFLALILATFIPTIELRGSIPLGILYYHLPWYQVFFVCVLANIFLGMIFYFFIEFFVDVVCYFKPINNLYQKYSSKVHKKISKYVERYGIIGVALFIAVPLPGSGVYSGGVGAFLLGMDYKEFMIASIFGVLIAGILVTLLVLSGNTLLAGKISTIFS